ncbi:ABC-type enterochelin transport system [Proteiniphilum saccharofermentans]|uniref:ABC-type enterochelin transport system n=1 Tax=Proteiniphilum saccharofermentans TaxID=1642647 RepID=A0A1R3TF25_9BACT|nr:MULTISPECIES: iron chelate uptake ABC transporter family permease subunit [Proteiniphilum]MDY9917834.1 iron chelate uptake ABC transporter family permease subunit [Proteiniphilum sp.]SCD22244.1 ABC-type enterochelin transport system [Proteiniphilum saccharofermentans]
MRTLILTLVLLVCAVVSLFVGVADISVADIFHWNAEKLALISISRIPRTAALILAGVGMSISGLIMQQMTQNKFVAPTTAGTLEAAKMGLLIFLIFIPTAGSAIKMILAFLFTFVASLIFLAIVRKIRYRNVVFVPLVGLMFGGIIGSISTFFAVRLNIVQDTNAWMMGDFSGILQGRYELIYLSLPAIIITYLYANKFTVIGMGEDFSRNLGLNYTAIMNIGLFCVSLTVSAVVITAGAIPFLGLIVPNVVSLLFGDNLKKTLPLVALSGAIFLLLCDIAGRVVIYPYEVPIGVTVSIIGAIIFLILIIRKR